MRKTKIIMIPKNTDEKRKRRDSGSIKTINGKLYARIQYTDEITGKRKEKLKPVINKTKAKEAIQQMRKELKENGQGALEKDKTSFKQVAEKYKKVRLVPAVIRNGIKVTGLKSAKNQEYMLEHLIDFFGNKSIRSIKASDLEAYKTSRIQTDVTIRKKIKKVNTDRGRKKNLWELVEIKRQRSIASVNRGLSLLRQIFSFAEAEDFITTNPFTKAKKIISLASEVSRDRVLSSSEEQQLLTACNKPYLKALIITAIDTAMRRGEMLKLIWLDVDFAAGVITVKASNTKTEKQRMIGMTPRVTEHLRTLWETSPKDLSGSVFGIKSNFKRSWHSALEKTGISDLHFHDLRHTAITRMIRAGVAASEVMKISGHTEMKTFQRYVNLTHESVTISANLLERFNAAQQMLSESPEVVS